MSTKWQTCVHSALWTDPIALTHCISFPFDYIIQSIREWLDEIQESLFWNGFPCLTQASSELNNVLWFWIAIHACCQNTSNIFSWRQIWWVRRPVSWLYVSWNVLIQPTNGCSRSMTPSAILLKNSVFLLREKLPLSNIASIRDSIKCRLHYLGQDIVNVIFRVNSCSLGNEVKRS